MLKKEKEITIKKSDWDKLKKLVDKVFGQADKLYNNFGGVDKVYRELGRYTQDLKLKVGTFDENKQELNSRLEWAWERGFRSGICFVDDELSDWIGEGIATRIDDKTFRKNYDWDKQVTKEIKRNKKLVTEL